MPERPLRPRRTESVEAAFQRGRPLVALESSVFAQGLMPPHNREAVTRMVKAVDRTGAVPAITAIVRGVPVLGMESDDLERFLARDGVRKLSARDIAWAMTQRADGATTVAGTLALCAMSGLSVFATGGIGGVHRDAPFDESADLLELARTPVVVVCAGAKSILDLHATIERLETLGVPVIGYRTREFPGFFTSSTGITLEATADDVTEIADAWRYHRALGRRGAMLIVQPPPAEHALERALVEDATNLALNQARAAGVRGGAVTPFLLGEVERRTHGASVQANLALLESNATLAGQIAVAITESTLVAAA